VSQVLPFVKRQKSATLDISGCHYIHRNATLIQWPNWFKKRNAAGTRKWSSDHSDTISEPRRGFTHRVRDQPAGSKGSEWMYSGLDWEAQNRNAGSIVGGWASKIQPRGYDLLMRILTVVGIASLVMLGSAAKADVVVALGGADYLCQQSAVPPNCSANPTYQWVQGDMWASKSMVRVSVASAESN
jgi:hypothetical protein